MTLPQFNLRDLLWLILVVAILSMWWTDRFAWQADVEELLGQKRRLSGEIRRRSEELDWAASDMYHNSWSRLQARERELGLQPTPNPFAESTGLQAPTPGDSPP